MFTPSFRHQLLRSTRARTTQTVHTLRSTSHPYSSSAALLQKDKKANLLDKDSINTNADEYSKSGGDASSAATADAAFSAEKTRPEEQHETAAQEAEQQGMSNPLNVSPANHDISQPNKGTRGGAQGSVAETGKDRETSRARTSGGGSSPKAGGGKSGGGGHM